MATSAAAACVDTLGKGRVEGQGLGRTGLVLEDVQQCCCATVLARRLTCCTRASRHPRPGVFASKQAVQHAVCPLLQPEEIGALQGY